MCFRDSWLIAGGGWFDDFSRIENGTFMVSDSIAEVFTYDEGGNDFMSGENQVPEAEYNAIANKYVNQKALLECSSDGISVQNRGLLPDPSAVMQNIYAAVQNSDFSFFAGTYSPYSDEYRGWYKNLTLDKNGILTGDSLILAIKPSSVTITEEGAIRCVLEEKTELLDGKYRTSGEIYEICPIGAECQYYNVETGEDFITDKLGVQIIYNWLDGYSAPFRMLYNKVS